MYKLIRMNAKTKEVSVTPTPEDYLRYGNRGMVAKILHAEVEPTCDPLGPDNKLILCTGLFAGTTVPSGYRLSIGAKSPLTGGVKEANAGGTMARYLSELEIKAIIIEDQPADDNWLIVHINKDGEASFEDGSFVVGLNTYETSDKLKERYGNNISVSCIGKAGEYLSPIASIQVTDFTTKMPARSAGRGGLGAIMGSKKIKAVVIDKAAKPVKVTPIFQEKYTETFKQLVAAMKGSPMVLGMKEGGTTGNGEMQLNAGVCPVRNFSGEKFEDEKIAKISREEWVRRANSYGGKQGCACQAGCIVGCSNVYNNEEGELITSGIEYETFGMFLPNLDIADYDFLAKCDHFCDNFGVDTIDLGGGIAILMEMGDMPYGDIDACLELFKEIEENKTDRAKLLLKGGDAVGKHYNCKHNASAKGQYFAAYDTRNMKGLGVSIATTTMGADHTTGLVVGPFDLGAKEGACEKSIGAQIRQTMCDNTICSFSWDAPFNDQFWADLYGAVYGIENPTIGMLEDIAKETLYMEHEFNAKAGITDDDEQIPNFMYEEPSFTGNIWDISHDELVETKHQLIDVCGKK